MLLFSAIHRIRQWQEHKHEVEKVIEKSLQKSEPCDEAMVLKATANQNQHISEHRVLPVKSQSTLGKGIIGLPHEPKSTTGTTQPPPVSEDKILREQTFVKADTNKAHTYDTNETKSDEKTSEYAKEIRKPAPKSSLEETSENEQNRESQSKSFAREAIEKRERALANTKGVAKPPQKGGVKDTHPSKPAKSLSQETNKTESSVDSTGSRFFDKMVQQNLKEMSSSAKEEENEDTDSEEDAQVPRKKVAPDAGEKEVTMVKSKSLPPPVPKPRSSPSRKTVSLESAAVEASKVPIAIAHKGGGKHKNEIEISNDENNETDEDENSEDVSGSDEYSEKEKEDSADEDDRSNEEGDDESHHDSELGEEDESGEDEASEEDVSEVEDKDAEDGEVEDNSDHDVDNNDDVSSKSGSESDDEEDKEVKAGKSKKIKDPKGSHEVEVHEKHPHDSSTNEASQDSEGVVMSRSPSSTKKTSITNKDKISITIIEFKASKGAKFLKNKNIEKLYIEYKFLDLPPEELETPSFPKPNAGGESFKLNFTKMIPIDRAENSKRRRKLSKMLTSEPSAEQVKDGVTDSTLVFTLVSEPPEDKEDQDCEDVGSAKIDLRTIVSSGQDMIEMNVDVVSAEVQSRVSRLLNTGNKSIGSLTISVEANEAFKSLRLK